MTDTSTAAPDKTQPHTFEAGPAVPAAYSAEGDPSVEAGGADLASANAKCALCGAPKSDQLHIDGKAQADDASPRWGL